MRASVGFIKWVGIDAIQIHDLRGASIPNGEAVVIIAAEDLDGLKDGQELLDALRKLAAVLP